MTESIEARLAPHVEAKWASAVILQLRLRGVSGQHIGEALAEVESHVVESGESALETFGEPVAYAKSLNLPVSPEQTRPAIATAVLPVLIQIVGMGLVLWAPGFWIALGILLLLLATAAGVRGALKEAPDLLTSPFGQAQPAPSRLSRIAPYLLVPIGTVPLAIVGALL